MKKLIPKIYALFLVLSIGLILSTKTAHAQSVIKLLGYDSLSIFIAEGLANILNNVQMVVSWILAVSGFLLNYSINLTLQLKAFLDQTPAIFTTWKAIRDISGLFIIFFLLFAALKLILGLGTKFGDLIKNIVIAGVLINFSFFFAGLGIDASNIVSIQLYNAISPANSLNIGNLKPEGIVSTIKDGGLSDIFMKSLKIPALYDTNGKVSPAGETAAAGGAWTAPIKILLVGFASIIVMLTATLSFAAAALAFIVRFVVLIFLLAFSPIWFASHIIPEIGSYAKKFTEVYKGMLVFMPVYLLLMYLALNVMTTTPILSGGNIAAVTTAAAAGATADWYSSIIAVLINAVIVIVLINVPLVAAMSVSSGVLKFINVEKIGAAGVLRFARNNTVGALGRKVIGNNAASLDKWASNTKIGNYKIGNSVLGRDFRAITSGALAKSKFGTARSAEDMQKLNKEIGQKNKEIDRGANLNKLMRSGADVQDINKALKEMGDKQKISLGADVLKDKKIAANLKGSDFEAIKKSDDFSDEDKKAIADARTSALEDAVAREDAPVIKHMVENMDGKDLLKLAGTPATPGILTNPLIISHLKQSHLKTLEDEGLDATIKQNIGNQIAATIPPHRSAGFVRKNAVSWTT